MKLATKDTAIAALERVVGRRADFPATAGTGARRSYREFWEDVLALASRICEAVPSRDAGVGLLVSDGNLAAEAIFAAYRSGRIAIPLNTEYPPDRLEMLLGDGDAAAIVADGAMLPLARRCAAGRPVLEIGGDRSRAGGPSLPPMPGRDDPAYILFTSGSSGRPKGVLHTHGTFWESVLLNFSSFEYAPEDRHLLIGSAGFGQANGVIYPALLSGGVLVSYDLPRLGVAGLPAFLGEEGVTVLHVVPAIFRMLVATMKPGPSLPSVRLVKLGGDTITSEDFRLFRDHFAPSCLLRTGMGSTEAGPLCHAFHRTEGAVDDPVTLGPPDPGVEFYLLDSDGSVARDGRDVGQLAVAAAGLSPGYWKNPELTARRFVPAPPESRHRRMFLTGDLVRRLPDGTYAHLGRSDAQIKVRGVRMELGEVETALRALPGVAQAAADARPAPDGDRHLVAYLVPRGNAILSRRSLREALRQTLPEPMIPTAFVFLGQLPLNPNGKVARDRLPPPPRGRPPGQTIVPPAGEAESAMAAIWESVLEISPIAAEDDFFELGGHSLQAALLFAEIERVWGQARSPSLLLEAPTVRALAAALGDPGTGRASTLVPLRDGSPEEPPVFLLPGSNGPGFTLRRLAELLPDGVPAYALHLPLPAGDPGPDTLEGWATRFLEDVVSRQRSGPYRVGGHSFGGIVAWELARQLRQAGREVEWVALFDAHGPNYPHRLAAPRRWAQKWADFLNRPAAQKIATLRRTVVRGARRISRMPPAVPESPASPAPSPRAWLAGGHLGSRIRAYRYPPLDCPVVLFRSTRKEEWIGYSFSHPSNAWAAIARGGFRVIATEGDHNTILEDPGVRTIAAELSSRILRRRSADRISAA